MNIAKRIYCRAYQFCFRMALPLMPYRNPKQLSSLEEIIPILQKKEIASVLLVADAGVYALGLTKAFETQMMNAGIRHALYIQKNPNPTIDNVEDAARIYRAANARAVIAIGGGSAIDCAKVVGARIARPRKPVQKMGGVLKVLRKTPLLFAAPTTAGTGSEATVAAVITDGALHHKYPINDFCLTPDYAVLDPKLTAGLPPFLTATTGLDALTHAVESYIGGTTNRFTRAMSIEAVRLIAGNLEKAYADGGDLSARRAMLRAAFCAGAAFTRSYVGYIHGIAHSLGGRYGIAHGLANAVILPRFLRIYGADCRSQLADLSRAAGIAPANASDPAAAETFIAWIETMNRKFSLPQTFPEIREADIAEMARHADHECNPLYPVPRLMDAEELAGVYLQLMKGADEIAA